MVGLPENVLNEGFGPNYFWGLHGNIWSFISLMGIQYEHNSHVFLLFEIYRYKKMCFVSYKGSHQIVD